MTSAPKSEVNHDEHAMRRALELGEAVRGTTSPNPWVGCVIDAPSGTFEGATQPPGGPHAEAVALAAAGSKARGATLYTTLEPCCHHGRTPPCTEAIVAAGVARVVVAVSDPDPSVSGRGIAALREAGIEVELGMAAASVSESLAPYLKHRMTGRPLVVLKLAASLDGRIAAPDGSSKWITGEQAREDVQRLRALCDAIVVGAGTVRADDPALTVRKDPMGGRQPLRVVLGRVPPGARVHPAVELSGDPGAVLDQLGSMGVLQVMVEGGAKVAHEFHTAGLVDRYVFYMAPMLLGGDDSVPMFAGRGAHTLDAAWRGRLVSVKILGADLRVEVSGSEPDGGRREWEAA
ncbi:MAG: bifunctional diaminohydroxyphosphoribosylaminopyrimidine deaminase/5-amino-6-(5-phosphoribosylamino)uracil reductase RibD [Acidimicrobiales bacterium]